MKAEREIRYRTVKLKRKAARHKRPLIVIGDVIVLLLLSWQLLPMTDGEIRRSRVDVAVESYYEVTADGRTVFRFADVDDSANVVGGSVGADSVVTNRAVAPGYWVNRISFIPSCVGSVITFAAPQAKDVASLDGDELRRFMFRQAVIADDKLAGLQRMRNELHYYKRKHDITDYGYNQIAEFSAKVDSSMDSLQAIVDTLQHVSPKAELSIRYVMRYTVVGDSMRSSEHCSVVKTYDGQFALVQVAGRHSPLSVIPRLSITRGMEQVMKSSADTVVKTDGNVIEIDSVGTYRGDIVNGKPNGVGKMYYANGAYYEGYWKDGRRDGFGFFVSPVDYLQAGTWKNGVFKGERLTYNASRVYGIDLSRHQHERNGKKYSIDWSRLRITDLGSATMKRIEGTVDYPVSFVYIKSTEGCTVFNSYYNSDYDAARAKGIHVGAYHFFSTTTPGYRQAWEFLKKTKMQKGDLAPVLDVEPTDWQVRQMGGKRILISNVEQWLGVVYKHTGVRPILYVGQDFAQKYLGDAPDITGNYLVWIARYGEYQPNLKLVIWQLSSDGRVSGIYGNVDINVFSGYKAQFQDFLDKHTIR